MSPDRGQGESWKEGLSVTVCGTAGGTAICRRRLRGDRVSDKVRVAAEGSAVVGLPDVPTCPQWEGGKKKTDRGGLEGKGQRRLAR